MTEEMRASPSELIDALLADYKEREDLIPPCQTSCRSPMIADDPHWSAI